MADAKLVVNVAYATTLLNYIFCQLFREPVFYVAVECNFPTIDADLNIRGIDIRMISQKLAHVFSNAFIGTLIPSRPNSFKTLSACSLRAHATPAKPL